MESWGQLGNSRFRQSHHSHSSSESLKHSAHLTTQMEYKSQRHSCLPKRSIASVSLPKSLGQYKINSIWSGKATWLLASLSYTFVSIYMSLFKLNPPPSFIKVYWKKIKCVSIYGVQCDILTYVHIVMWLHQASGHIQHPAYLPFFCNETIQYLFS